MKTECTGHTEPATHLTTRLRRDAERSAVVFGYIDGLDELLAYLKEVLARSVYADRFADWSMPTDGIVRLERLTSFEGYIGHLVKRSYPLDIEPFRQLFAGELLQADA